MNIRGALLNLVVCAAVGGLLAALTPAKWLAASLWVFAALFLNGSLAFFEDEQPGGFENSAGSDTPAFVRGLGALGYWAKSLAIVAAVAAAGFFVQFHQSARVPLEEPPSQSLTRVFAWVMAIVIGGIGAIAVSLGTEFWHLLVGLPMVLLAAWLVRVAR